MILKGTVAEIKKDKKNQACICIDFKSDKVRLLLTGNKEITLPEDKILFTSEYKLDVSLPREELVKKLKEINDTREDIKKQIPLGDLWELLAEDGGTYSPMEIADLNFGKEINGDKIAGVYRALDEDTVYFKCKKALFSPNARENVEQILQMYRVEREKELQNNKIMNWIKNVYQGQSHETDKDINAFIEKLKQYQVNKCDERTSRYISDLFQKLNISGQNLPFKLLLKAGIWDEDENLDIYEYDVPHKFKDELLKEAEEIANQKVIKTDGRIDFSNLHTFTIDSEYTQDMDDAISFEKTENGYTIGVHITDVSEYILPDTGLDLEARARCTSIYMPDKKISMFPDILSTNMFSLIQGEKRPAISITINVNDKFDIEDYKIRETIIEVKERFTYEHIDLLIKNNETYGLLYEITKKFREIRKARGARFFYTPELEIIVDENRDIKIEICDSESPSHQLVSEMMILANQLTAKFCNEHSIPIIYRAQPQLDENCNLSDGYDPVVIFQQRKFFKKSEMATEPSFHHGIGVDLYTQMSSPIRRYSDLLIHRQIKSYIKTASPFYKKEQLEDFIMTLEHSIDIANIITRRRKRYWLLRYLKRMIGQNVKALVLQDMSDRIILFLREYLLEVTCLLNYTLNLIAGDEIDVRIETVNPREDIIKVSIVR